MTAVRQTIHDRTAPAMALCATGKTGLGHLRRVTNVAGAVKRLAPAIRLDLYSNAEVAGLATEEQENFTSTNIVPRDQIAATVMNRPSGPIVVDTAMLPGLEQADSPLCLLLRETIPERLREFRLENGRDWDLVCVPNPETHWMPDPEQIGAKRIEAAGWIFRKPVVSAIEMKSQSAADIRTILICSGGGGTLETASFVKREVGEILDWLKRLSSFPLEVSQVAGPRMSREATLRCADHIIEPGAHLNEIFDKFDLVISTAGYNSVLELAQMDVPVVLIPITRSLDDQAARARHWASHLGYMHVGNRAAATAHWIARKLQNRERREPCNLDTGGAERCARLLLEYVS